MLKSDFAFFNRTTRKSSTNNPRKRISFLPEQEKNRKLNLDSGAVTRPRSNKWKHGRVWRSHLPGRRGKRT